MPKTDCDTSIVRIIPSDKRQLNRMHAVKRLLRPAMVIACLFFFQAPDAWSQSDPFPEYPSLRPNVVFWTDVYSRYTSEQGVLHDKDELSIVYEVIELVHRDVPGSRRINRQRTKLAKKRYRKILRKLALGEPPADFEEQRLVDLLGPQATPSDYYHYSRNIRCQVGQRNFFKAGLVRSGAYLTEIKRIFSDYGLPEDLVYLPHVESSFNPKAYSKFGAAGIWQFTRSTGKRYMKVGYTVDERRDPILASHAAAKLLKRNYDRLQNWPMAITAYNHGLNGVLRARRAEGSYEAIFNNYSSRLFKFASRNFYSEFLAAREVAKNYRFYFGELDFDPPMAHDQVTLGGYALLPEMARRLEVELDTIRDLNPALRKPVYTGQRYVPKGYRLNLPSSGRDWSKVLADLSGDLFKDAQKRSRFYKVRRGDTAGKVARRHRVRLADLIAANNLDGSATIHVNQILTIPLPDKPSAGSAGRARRRKKAIPKPAPAKTQVVAKAPAVAKPPAVKKAPAIEKTPEKPTMLVAGTNIALQPTGESAAGPKTVNQPPVPQVETTAQPPAAQPKTPDRSLVPQPEATAQSSVPEPVKAPAAAPTDVPAIAKTGAGQQPAIQPPAQLAAETSPAAETGAEMDGWMVRYRRERTIMSPTVVGVNLFFENMQERNGVPIGVLRVEVEETIGHYAEWAGVRAQDIRRLNRLSYGRLIHLGQPLKIPLHRVAKDDFETQRHEYHKELVEDFLASYRIEEVQYYTIKRGDNIWTLSREAFELPLWLIRRYNLGIDFNALMPSQTLLVPVVEKVA